MKRIIIILCSILAIVVLTYGLLTALSSQNDLRVELTQGEIGVLPLVDQKVMVEIVPGLRFKFDTGSDISTITEADLERLREMGMSVEKKFYPVMGRDGDGKTRICFDRYTVSICGGYFEIAKLTVGGFEGYCVGG